MPLPPGYRSKVESRHFAHLCSTSPLGPPWPTWCSKRGHSSFISWIGVWHDTHFDWAVPRLNRTAFSWLHQAAPVLNPSPYKASLIRWGHGLSSGQAVEGRVCLSAAWQRGAALAPLYLGVFKMLEAGKKFFIISLGGREDMVSVDRLKSHLGGPVVLASPAPRCHPPRVEVTVASNLPRPLLGGGGEPVEETHKLIQCS
jgi:hypothetical protein